MTEATRPYRSALYIPGSKPRALDKARGLDADVILFDLEDAVTPDEKPAARDTLAAALAEGGFGDRLRVVRINGLETQWGADDLATVASARPDAILLPKVSTPKMLQELEAKMDAHAGLAEARIWAMMETPLGVLNAAAIATATPRLAGFVMGTNDLAKEIGSRDRADRLALLPSLQMCLLAARAAGLVAIDGVYNAFKDEDGLRAECEQGRDLGFDGKSLIHPAQLDVANAAFAPSADEVALAERQIAAFEETERSGQGVAVVDGKIVENLHVETARRILGQAAAITARAAGGAA